MKVKTFRHNWWAGLLSIAIFSAPALTGRVEALGLDTAQSPTTTNSAGAVNIQSDPVSDSVVKIYSTIRYPDPYKPWTKLTPSDITGSGVVIRGKRILTNAHVVLYASEIQVEGQSGNLIPATVEAIAPAIDLAVLKLDDDSFFVSHPPMELAASTPEIQDTVEVYGYPVGGDNLSITKGIVSRVEFANYNYPVSGLRVQIDAAVNPGNSGGPAIVNGRMIGIAFSRLGGTAENIGYIIPCEEINLFLQQTASGTYGKPCMWDDCRSLINPTLRSFLKLDDSVQGVVVSDPASADKDYPLKKWDVITQIGNTPIDDEGMVNLNDNLRVNFKYLIQKISTNGVVPLAIVRDGKQIPIQLPVPADRPRVMPDLNGGYPSYFVYGPIVFSGATRDFVDDIMASRLGATAVKAFALTDSPLVARMGDEPAFDGEGLVVVSSPLFPDRLSTGFGNPFGEVVKSVNGIPIKNLKHLVQVLRDSKDRFIRIEFYGKLAPLIVFPRAEMADETFSILSDNDIRSQGSPDVMAVWNATASR